MSINSKSAILHCSIHLIRETKAYDTWDSQAVSDPSTNQAQRCLTCQIGRDGVFSTWYGRKRNYRRNFSVMMLEKGVMERGAEGGIEGREWRERRNPCCFSGKPNYWCFTPLIMFMLFLFTNTRITSPLKPSLHESEVVQILDGVFVYGIVD